MTSDRLVDIARDVKVLYPDAGANRRAFVESLPDVGFERSGVQFEPWGLVFDSERPLSFEEWEGLGITFAAMKRAVHYWIGDWYLYGEDRWGEDATQGIDPDLFSDGGIGQAFGYSLKTTQNDVFVCRNVPARIRAISPSFGHSDAVASLELRDQERVLRQADRMGWSVTKTREVRRRVQVVRRGLSVQDPDPIPDVGNRVREKRFRRLVGLYLMVEDAIQSMQYGGGRRLALKVRQKERVRAAIIRSLNGEGEGL